MRFALSTILILACSATFGQGVKRYNFGKPATVVSMIKEVIVWEDGKKLSHNTYPGVRTEIFLSDSLVKITEPDTVYEYPIKELRVDQFQNVSFLQADGTIIRWHRQRRIVQIEPAATTEEIIYMIE